MSHLQILSAATRTGAWKIADDESVLQLLVDGTVVAEVAPWTDKAGDVSFWAASAGTRDLGCGSILDACRSAALDAGVIAPVPDELRIALGERVAAVAQPVEVGAPDPLLDRLADLLAAILDEPLATLPGSDPASAVNEPLQLRLAHFRPDLSEVAARLLEEAGR